MSTRSKGGSLGGEPNERDAEFIANARQDVPALLAEVARLRAALLYHGRHDDGCDAHENGPGTCTCGFDDACGVRS